MANEILGKYKMMQSGVGKNIRFISTQMASELMVTNQERDLGVSEASSVKPSSQPVAQQ